MVWVLIARVLAKLFTLVHLKQSRLIRWRVAGDVDGGWNAEQSDDLLLHSGISMRLADSDMKGYIN